MPAKKEDNLSSFNLITGPVSRWIHQLHFSLICLRRISHTKPAVLYSNKSLLWVINHCLELQLATSANVDILE